jgi:hypothetical protein
MSAHAHCRCIGEMRWCSCRSTALVQVEQRSPSWVTIVRPSTLDAATVLVGRQKGFSGDVEVASVRITIRTLACVPRKKSAERQPITLARRLILMRAGGRCMMNRSVTRYLLTAALLTAPPACTSTFAYSGYADSRVHAERRAYGHGYEEGREEGRNDARHRRPFEPRRHRAFRKADDRAYRGDGTRPAREHRRASYVSQATAAWS